MLALYHRFLHKTSRMRNRADHIYDWPNSNPDWEFQFLSISLIFECWHYWCEFCREVVLASCAGTVTRSGTMVNRRAGDNSWQRIGYELKNAARSERVRPSALLSFKRQEPTWGDTSVLLRGLSVVAPSNVNTLTTGFGLSLSGPRRIQLVRNACAHLNSETMYEIRNLSFRYIGSALGHPSEILWWLDPNLKSDAFYCWLNDLEIIADVVTK